MHFTLNLMLKIMIHLFLHSKEEAQYVCLFASSAREPLAKVIISYWRLSKMYFSVVFH